MRIAHDRKVDILSATLKDDSAGTADTVWSMRHYQLPCTIVPISGTEARTFGKDAHIGNFLMYCRVVTIAQSDIVVDGSTTYEVLDVRNVRGNHLYVTLGKVN